MITVQRQPHTIDGIEGTWAMDFDPFKCFTMENLADAIPAGTYDIIFDQTFDMANLIKNSPILSKIPNLVMNMPHIIVPSRDILKGGYGMAGIRVHWGSFPKNYKGCIGVGDKEDPDAIEDTQVTFSKLYPIMWANRVGLQITIKDPIV